MDKLREFLEDIKLKGLFEDRKLQGATRGCQATKTTGECQASRATRHQALRGYSRAVRAVADGCRTVESQPGSACDENASSTARFQLYRSA